MILKTGLAAALVMSFLVAFLLVRTSDETAPVGTNVVINVWDTGDLSRERGPELVTAAAQTHGLTLYRGIDSVVNDHPTRALIVVHEGADRTLPDPHAPYDDFGRSLETRFLPVTSPQAAGSALGTYFTGAGLPTADRFADDLRASGMTVTTKSFSPAAVLLWTAEILPLFPLVIAGLLILLVACIHSTVGARRQDALRRVHGASWRRLALEHAAVAGVTGLVFGAAGYVVALPVLALYNGLAQFGRVAEAAAAAVGVVTLAAAVFVGSTCLVERRVQPFRALRGDRPLRRLAFLGLAVHTTALALVLVVVLAVVDASVDAFDNRRDARLWARAHSYVSLSFRLSNSEFDGLEQKIAGVGRQQLERGSALLAVSGGAPTGGYGPDSGNSLIVSTRYLAEQTVVDADGRRISEKSLDPDALTLLVPDDVVRDPSSLVDEYREWVEFQAHVDGARATGRDERVPIRVVAIRSGQSSFTYGVQEPTSRQVGAVVAVIPKGASVLSDDLISAEMTHGGVLFSDRNALRRALDAAGLESSIVVIERVAELAAVRLGGQERVAGVNLVAGVLALILAVLSALILTTSIAEQNRRIDFLRYVHGRLTFGAIGAPLLVLIGASLGLLGLAQAGGLLVNPVGRDLAVVIIAGDCVFVALAFHARRRALRLDTVTRS